LKCRDLGVWQRAVELSSEIYLALADLRDYGFKDQITRSSLSVPSNIAEGIERISDRETMRFLDIARASAAEVQTQIYVGIKIAYVEKIQGERWIAELDEISKMITGLIKNIKRNLQN